MFYFQFGVAILKKMQAITMVAQMPQWTLAIAVATRRPTITVVAIEMAAALVINNGQYKLF